MPRMDITFLGGATTVTGSAFLISTDRAKVLVDCGMFQGSPNESIRNRVPFGFDPAELDAVLLTHAHLDHCGRLPLLVRGGYDGKIHATAGTVELATLVLLDSGHLHEEFAKREARWERRYPDEAEADDRREADVYQAAVDLAAAGGSEEAAVETEDVPRVAVAAATTAAEAMTADARHATEAGEHVETTVEPEPPVDWATHDPEAELRRQPPVLQVDLDEALYTAKDAERAVEHFRPIEYDEAREVAPGVFATFLDAGHILGAAMVRLDIDEKGRKRTLLFSGDLGRKELPIVRDPEPVDRADILILETTYGNRDHPPLGDTERQFVDLVRRTVDRKGKILIPAFAVGRTQHITYLLNNLSAEGRIPPVPVFVDSPLALETTEVFRKHPDCWDPEMVKLLRQKNDADPFGFRLLTYVRSADESKKLNDLDGPAIIIAASGMCESGRILHHLANHAQNVRNTILIVGYQAEGTLGRRIVEGATQLRILGRDVERRAQVVKMNALSAHAGRADLQKFYAGFKNRVRNLFLVHGEPVQSEGFAAWAKEHSSASVAVPDNGQAVEL